MTRGPSTQILVFDLMDTVVADPFFIFVPRLLGPLSELGALIDRTAWPAFERGEIDEETFFKRLFIAPDDSLPPPEAFKRAICDNYSFLPGVEELLSRLKQAGDELWILSNYPVWFEVVREKLGLDRYFSGSVLSYQTGVRKPEPEAYLAVCEQTSRPPSEHLLIDDRQANVDGALAVGMQALLFDGADALEKVLTP